MSSWQFFKFYTYFLAIVKIIYSYEIYGNSLKTSIYSIKKKTNIVICERKYYLSIKTNFYSFHANKNIFRLLMLYEKYKNIDHNL